MEEKSNTIQSFSEKCACILTQKRKVLSIGFASICIIGVIALITAFITARKAKDFSASVEALISEWAEIRTKNADDMHTQEDAYIAKLEAQAVVNGHPYAAFRANAALGEIYVLRKDWEKALVSYQKSGESLPGAYTAGIAYFNAAACADELKQYEKALELYTLSANNEDFPLKPRALFNVGRMEEMLAHSDKAIEAYTKLAELYPDNKWALLGKSRVIALSVKQE